MTNEQLEELRSNILNDIVPLIATSSNGVDKFNVVLRLIQSGHTTPDIYIQAYESAKSIENQDEKMGALMALLDEVETDLAAPIEESDETHSPGFEDPQQS